MLEYLILVVMVYQINTLSLYQKNDNITIEDIEKW